MPRPTAIFPVQTIGKRTVDQSGRTNRQFFAAADDTGFARGSGKTAPVSQRLAADSRGGRGKSHSGGMHGNALGLNNNIFRQIFKGKTCGIMRQFFRVFRLHSCSLADIQLFLPGRRLLQNAVRTRRAAASSLSSSPV